MAVPKNKTSRSKRDHRRGHVHLKAPNLSTCSNCGTMIRSHRVCPECGYFKGVQVIKTEEN